jgi:hypothetical protein
MNIAAGLGISRNSMGTIPDSLDGIVLYYDFTNFATLRQDRDGTGMVSSNNDPVEWVQNIASGDANGILGSFARSYAAGAAYGGIFKTGGANGQSYVQFDDDGTETERGFRAGFISTDATDDGGVAADKFSDVTLDADNYTILTVLKHDDPVVEDDDYAMFINAYPTGYPTSDCQIAMGKAQGTEKFYSSYVFIAGGIDFESTVANDTLDSNVHAFLTVSGSGTNERKLYEDGTAQTDTDTADDRTFNFDRSTGATTAVNGAAIVGVGGRVLSGGATKAWHGGIYEVIIWSRTLSDSEIDSLEVYLAGKYGITFS